MQLASVTVNMCAEQYCSKFKVYVASHGAHMQKSLSTHPDAQQLVPNGIDSKCYETPTHVSIFKPALFETTHIEREPWELQRQQCLKQLQRFLIICPAMNGGNGSDKAPFDHHGLSLSGRTRISGRCT